MPTYHVEMMENRTLEQKRKLIEEITRVSVEVLGGSPESVDIIITDIKRHDWATGGKLWLDPDGQCKFPRLWPPQTPPGKDSGIMTGRC